MLPRVVCMLLVASAGLSATAAARAGPLRHPDPWRHRSRWHGGAPFRADVGIIGKHIARIGDLTSANAETLIDANGPYVTPVSSIFTATPCPGGTVDGGEHADPRRNAGNPQPPTASAVSTSGSSSLTSPLRARVNIGASIGFNSAWAIVARQKPLVDHTDDITKMRQIPASNLAQGAWVCPLETD